MSKFTGYFKVVPPKPSVTTMADSQNIGEQGSYANYTWYQRLVQGSASRLTRYREYDMMDNDVEIARSLDTIAEEMIGNDPNSDMPIELVIDSEKTERVPSNVVLTLKTSLRYWADLHDWHNRLFKLARATVKYGDCFFIRKSDTKRWEFIHPKNVIAAIVDENDMTKVVGWQIRVDSKKPNSPYNSATGGQFAGTASEVAEIYGADDIVWFSLNDDMSESAPFGESVLRAVYRSFKQKELLEDAILIYRIQRAPERRVFYLDTGKMPPHRRKQFLESFKNEIRQKKIPSYGGGTNQVDSVYNPQQMSEDFFFAESGDGPGNRVETLPGGQGLGELSDLEYFENKVLRGLRIPLSFMREGQDGGLVSDGKTGIAYIQELRFAMYIMRLQGSINTVLDREFKRYLRAAGIKADPTMFHIKLNDPENFGIYRQQQLDTDLLNTYTAASGIDHLSKRFAMRKFMQMTEEEIITNFRMRCEELGIDPEANPQAAMLAVYGPQTEAGGDMGLGGGMVAGTLGGPGFNTPLGGSNDLGMNPMDMGSSDGLATPDAALNPAGIGDIPQPPA